MFFWNSLAFSTIRYWQFDKIKGFSIVNEAEDVFLEFPCFLYDQILAV